jgi:pimeloyl-ACP methyl ester carboxylesterase
VARGQTRTTYAVSTWETEENKCGGRGPRKIPNVGLALRRLWLACDKLGGNCVRKESIVAAWRTVTGCCLVSGLVFAWAPPASAQVPTAPAVPLAITIDGSGEHSGIAATLAGVAAAACQPLQVEPFGWGHGGRIFLDLYDQDNHCARGKELAARVAAYRATCPTGKLYLVAHSSGSAVVLAAAEHLLPGSVDSIILLAPAVWSGRDLRPALRCAANVDVFYTSCDVINQILGILGTADGGRFFAAGTTGFRPVGEPACADATPLGCLRHHPHAYYGHYGCTRAAFLRCHVLPLLPGSPAAPPPPVAATAPSAITPAAYSSSYRAPSTAAPLALTGPVLPWDKLRIP